MLRRAVMLLSVLAACSSPAAHAVDASIDAAHPDAAPDARPLGSNAHYVVNTLSLPATTDDANAFGLDIGGPDSDTPDGVVDNQLGHVLAAFASQGVNFQTTVTTALDRGDPILLIDTHAASAGSGSATFQIAFGDDPSPAPCDGSADTTCGHQFMNGSFGIGSDSPTNPPLDGAVSGSAYDAGPGALEIELGLGSGQPAVLTLQNARVHATQISFGALGDVIVDGGVSTTDLDTQLIPAFQAAFTQVVAQDCTALADPPDCGCTSGSTGATLLGLFDGDLEDTAKDCAISDAEITGNSLIRALLAPDVCLEATCTEPDALSFGLTLTAVPAAFTLPGE